MLAHGFIQYKLSCSVQSVPGLDAVCMLGSAALTSGTQDGLRRKNAYLNEVRYWQYLGCCLIVCKGDRLKPASKGFRCKMLVTDQGVLLCAATLVCWHNHGVPLEVQSVVVYILQVRQGKVCHCGIAVL